MAREVDRNVRSTPISSTAPGASPGTDGEARLDTTGDGAANPGGVGGDAGDWQLRGGTGGTGTLGGDGAVVELRGGSGGDGTATGGAGAAVGIVGGNAGTGGNAAGGDANLQAGTPTGTGTRGRQKIGTVNANETEFGASRRRKVTSTAINLILDHTQDLVFVTAGDKQISLPDATLCPGREYEIINIFITDWETAQTTIESVVAGQNGWDGTQTIGGFNTAWAVNDGAKWYVTYSPMFTPAPS